MCCSFPRLLTLHHELRIVDTRPKALPGQLEVLGLAIDDAAVGPALLCVPADTIADAECCSHTWLGARPVCWPEPAIRVAPTLPAMKKILVLVLFVALAAVAAKKVRAA